MFKHPDNVGTEYRHATKDDFATKDVNERVLRIMLLKNGKEVSSLSWINVYSFIHKILIFYLLNLNRHLGI